VQHREQVIRVVVDLRPLPAREHVLEVERVPAETRGQTGDDVVVERLEVDPGEPFGGELSDAGLWMLARLDLRQARPGPPDAGKAWHRY
jgi:hypothetical protein